MLPGQSSGASQNLHPLLVAGTRVRVRGTAWRVDRVSPFKTCTVVHLVGIGHDNVRERRTLIHPFDRLKPDSDSTTLRVVRARRWAHTFEHLLATHHPYDGLRAAASARIDLLPYQLEPTLAIVRGVTCRVLLADDVGLGKTIQAGLLIAELRARGSAERTLIVTPAGLRRQWLAELETRFAIPASIIDRSTLQRRATGLSAGANPWLIDEVAIVSIDLIKRAEALRSLRSLTWDLLVVDEVHAAIPGTRRHAAVHALGLKARRLALLSATPHAGDSKAFDALCRIGSHDTRPLAMFRRTRQQTGAQVTRRVRSLAVRLTPAELRVHQQLRRYTDVVMNDRPSAGAALAMAVLTKRGLSGPVPLRISLERRLRSLSSAGAPVPVQRPLPLDIDDSDDTDDRDLEPAEITGDPGLTDRPRELRLLTDVLASARAVPVGRKIPVLIRLLTRIQEPAIVFTEYRDTLQYIVGSLPRSLRCAVIHGGLSEPERVGAQSAFVNGSARVLVATDAAGEGLNLQARCRLVINFELPWNPMRLEQRIGRVDRIGQQARVHAIHLLGRDTAEMDVLARLVTRLTRVRRTLPDVGDPIGMNPEMARIFLDADSNHHLEKGHVWRPSLGAAASAEARRLQTLRARGHTDPKGSAGSAQIAVSRRAGSKGHLRPPCVIWVMRTHLVDGNGQLLEPCLVPIVGQLGPLSDGFDSRRVTRRVIRSLHHHIQETLEAVALAVAGRRVDAVGAACRATVEALRLRQFEIVRALGAEPSSGRLFQAGLFDARTQRDHEALIDVRARALESERERLNRIDASRTIHVAPGPELVLVLVVAPPW